MFQVRRTPQEKERHTRRTRKGETKRKERTSEASRWRQKRRVKKRRKIAEDKFYYHICKQSVSRSRIRPITRAICFSNAAENSEDSEEQTATWKIEDTSIKRNEPPCCRRRRRRREESVTLRMRINCQTLILPRISTTSICIKHGSTSWTDLRNCDGISTTERACVCVCAYCVRVCVFNFFGDAIGNLSRLENSSFINVM